MIQKINLTLISYILVAPCNTLKITKKNLLNFLVNQKGWIGNFNDLNYTEWNKRKQSLTYTFNNEMTSLCQLENNFDDIDFQTGDILLFSAKKGCITNLIKCWTHSKYNHVAIVIKDPNFHDFKKKGIYMMESTTLDPLPDAESHCRKFGVQMHLLKDVLAEYNGSIYVRHLHCDRNVDFDRNVIKFHQLVHGDPYNLNMADWLELILHDFYFDEYRTNEFTCSALVAFFLVSIQAISAKTPFALIRPCDFGLEKIERYHFKFINGCLLEDSIKII